MTILVRFCATSCAVLLGAITSCNGPASADCSNVTCGCPQGTTCSFSCDSPPCQIDCQSGSTCTTAACADGTCTCEVGASCNFVCTSGPCHVQCVGSNPYCVGECWDGQCTCGSGSRCSFTCDSPPCHAQCDPGSSCTVLCPQGTGTSNCDIPSCGSGPAVVCGDGHTLACNASCP
jgi:hypothetical protein